MCSTFECEQNVLKEEFTQGNNDGAESEYTKIKYIRLTRRL